MDSQFETRKRLSVALGLAASPVAAGLLCTFLVTSPAPADSTFDRSGAVSSPDTLIQVSSVASPHGTPEFNSQLSPQPVETYTRSGIQVGSQIASLTLVSETSADLSNSMARNDGGSLAAAGAFVKAACTDPCTGGHAANGRRGTVAPSTLLLVGSALAGLGAVTRRLFKAGKRAGGRVPLRV